MGYVFRHRRRVEFSETDVYRALGISVTQGDITFPRVHAEFDFGGGVCAEGPGDGRAGERGGTAADPGGDLIA